ncbi:MAG: DUF4861 domain-containing protein [Mediterranea massiliensis]|nr:DUF4861 domain-containing protein [Mediterranea massiliensis]
MRFFYFLLMVAGLFTACSQPKSELTVQVTNKLPLQRTAEMIELSMEEIADELAMPDTAQLIVLDEKGEQLPYQITHDGLLIFPATVAPDAKSFYTIKIGQPIAVGVKACGRVYPERMDDLAWENDLIACRAYGPTMQRRGERGFGYDIFTKRGTTDPVVEEMYAGQCSEENWKQYNEIRKKDPKAAREFEQSFSYHVDHGYGMDCYAVGPTLGAGVSALVDGEKIVYPWCYKEAEVLDNGPLRFTAKLIFHPLAVQGDTSVVETRIITLDTGSRLNRTSVSYSNLKEDMPIVTGIVLHEPDGQVVADAENGYMTYVDPTTGPGNGKIFMGAAFPAKVKEAKPVLFSPEEKRMRNNADGHVLAYSNYKPGASYTYYWGFGWDRADMPTADAWNAYMKDFAQKVRTPLKVKIQ